MEFKDLTLASLKEKRPDLVKDLTESVTRAVQESLKDGDATKALEAKVTEAEAATKKLTEENDALKVKDAERERQEMITAKLAKAELPETAVTDQFKEQLGAAKDEAALDALIADRKALIESVSTGGAPKLPAKDIDALIREVANKGKRYKDVTPDTIHEARQTLFT